jgi:hypothetical protein
MRTTLLSIAVLPVLTCAQSWCPPGAEWIFNFVSDQATGVRRAWYSGDTLVGGLPCQRIDQTIIAYEPIVPFGSAFTQQDSPIFTHGQGDLIRIWDQAEGVFDTLAWFGAAPGDRWNLPEYAGPLAYFEVLDTGTRVVSGMSLRYLVVEEPAIMGFVDTLVERIGFEQFYLRPLETMLLDFNTNGLVCYRDDDLGQFDGWWPGHPCDFTLSLNEALGTSGGILFPNPGTTHFTLDLPPTMHRITLLDATGRMVLQQRTTDARPVIDTGTLPAGLYRITAHGKQGAVLGATWVKE